MTTVYKYPLALRDGKQTIAMPSGARVLTVADQRGEPTLWAQVDTDSQVCSRAFVVVGTGHPISTRYGDSLIYVGTAFCGGFVWHVYEVTP